MVSTINNQLDNFNPTELFTEAEEKDFSNIPDRIEGDDDLVRLSKDLGLDTESIILNDEGKIIKLVLPDGTILHDDENLDDNNSNLDDNSNDEELKPINDLDFIFKKIGLKNIEKIEIEEGVIKNIEELTKEEQLSEIVSLVENLQEQSKKSAPTIKEILSDEEIGFVNYLRTPGKSLQTLVQDLIENNPANKIKGLSDEDLVKFALKENRPSYSEEDIELEVKDLKERNKLEREAKHYRMQYEVNPDELDIKTNLANLTEQQKKVVIQETFQQLNEVVNASKEINEIIKGFKIDDSIRAEVMKEIIPPGIKDGDLSKDAPIVELFNSPQGIFELAYYKTQLPKMIKAFVEWGKNEREEGRKEILGKIK